MKLNNIKNISFQGLKEGNLSTIARVHISNLYPLKEEMKDVDVFIKSVEHYFPQGKYPYEISAIKMSIMPKGLNFFQRLFSKQKITDYFPIGELGKSINYEGSIEDFFRKNISIYYKKFKH